MTSPPTRKGGPPAAFDEGTGCVDGARPAVWGIEIGREQRWLLRKDLGCDHDRENRHGTAPDEITGADLGRADTTGVVRGLGICPHLRAQCTFDAVGPHGNILGHWFAHRPIAVEVAQHHVIHLGSDRRVEERGSQPGKLRGPLVIGRRCAVEHRGRAVEGGDQIRSIRRIKGDATNARVRRTGAAAGDQSHLVPCGGEQFGRGDTGSPSTDNDVYRHEFSFELLGRG